MNLAALDPTFGIQPPITFNTSNLASTAKVGMLGQPFIVQGIFIGLDI